MLPRRIRTDGFIEPCIPTRAVKPPAGLDWVHEIKHDGYRLIVRRDGETVRLFTRRGYDWTDRYPAIAAAAAKLRAKSFTLDGEAVVAGEDGVAVFDALHRRHKATDAMLYAFDLLELDGKDFRPLPLGDRKARLAKLLARAPAGIVYNEHADEDGAVVFRHACKMGLEGIVSKRLGAPYRSGLDQGQEPGQPGDDPGTRTFRAGGTMTGRRFPPPWTVVEHAESFWVQDAGGQTVGWFYFRTDPLVAKTAGVLLKDEARRMAVNFARLPELLGKGR